MPDTKYENISQDDMNTETGSPDHLIVEDDMPSTDNVSDETVDCLLSNGRSTRTLRHISHLDLDGYGATILSELIPQYLPDGYMTVKTSNILPNRLLTEVSEVIDNLDEWDMVVITDLAMNPDVVNIIMGCKNPEKFRVFDHHCVDITNPPETFVITEHSPINKGRLTCATELYYDFLTRDPFYDMIRISGNPSALQYFVECVRVYDTFEFWKTRNDPKNEQYTSYVDAPRLNTLFHILERSDFKNYIFNYLMSYSHYLTYSSTTYPYITEILNLELNKNNRYVETTLRRLTKTDLVCTIYRNGQAIPMSYHIGVVFAEKNGPVIGNTACETNEDIDFCAVVSNNQISLYTNRPHINVSEIAKLFGGGGHADAAGLAIPYISANVYNLQHFFNIIECAGRMIPDDHSSDTVDESSYKMNIDMTDTN